MPKISLRLDPASIDSAIKELEAYRDRVRSLAEELVKELVNQGVEIARLNVTDMKAYDSGDLYNSIHGEYRDKIGVVRTEAGHAIFVEFGTGVVGEKKQHPEIALAGWKYDVNEHGELGWWYRGKDRKLHWTMGMPSRPYMYNTAKRLRQLIAPTAKELLKNDRR